MIQDGNMKCVPGWSGWINQDKVDERGSKYGNANNTKVDDNEPLPTDMQMV